MYELKYDFKQYNTVISAYMEILINNSMNNFQQQIRSGQVINHEHDADALAGCIQNLEEYLYYNYTNSPENFNHILNSTINNVKTISVLPDDKRGIYGETQAQNKLIFINPDLINGLLPIIIGSWTIIQSIIKFQLAFNMKSFNAPNWAFLLIGSIMTFVIGIIILLNPFGTAIAITQLCGIFLFVSEVINIIESIFMLKS